MKKCYVVTLWRKHDGYEVRFVLGSYPTYLSVLRRLPNWLRRLLATDKESVKFELGLKTFGISFPLFKNNPTGKERYRDDFPLRANFIGRLSVQVVNFYKN